MKYTDPAHKDLHKKHNGYLELPLLKAIKALPFRRGVFVDIGANVGNHTVYFAKEMERMVYAYEPHPKTFQVLKENTKEFSYFVFLHEMAIGSTMRTELITDKKHTGQNCLSDSGEFPVLVKPLEISERVAFIKIDVEGMELDTLAGCMQVINRDKPDLAVETNNLNEVINKLPKGYKAMAKFGGAPTYIIQWQGEK